MASMPLPQSLGYRKDETGSSTMNCCVVDEPPDANRNACTAKTLPIMEPATLQLLQAKKSSFQITRVVSKSDGDSIDDLDDVTNTEDVSSEVHDTSHMTDVQPDHWSSAETVHSPCDFSPRSPRFIEHQHGDSPQHHLNDSQSRFRIVKVESRTPSRIRGRWTCMDFSDPPLAMQTSVSAGAGMGESGVASAVPPIYFVDDPSCKQFTPAFVYADGHPVLERTPLNSLADNNIYNTAPSEPGATAACTPNSSSAHHLDGHLMSLSGLADVIGRPGDLFFLQNSSSTHLSDGNENQDSAAATFAIDNKIEQAMDLVKSHLMFAVHEEVELLKEQIKELMVKNAQLEYENGILRAAASPETLARLEASTATAGRVSSLSTTGSTVLS